MLIIIIACKVISGKCIHTIYHSTRLAPQCYAFHLVLIVVVIVVEIIVLNCNLSQLQAAKSRKLTQLANRVKLMLQLSHFRASSNLSSLSPNQSPLCIVYFTTKTTPKNYDKRIHPLKTSWFQKVHTPEMVSQ